ncbi:hypothetical protein ACI5KX_03795 [Erythrobacter sp. GH1-10]
MMALFGLAAAAILRRRKSKEKQDA